MKTFNYFLLATIAMVSLAFASCSKDETEEYVYLSSEVIDNNNVLDISQKYEFIKIANITERRVSGSSLEDVKKKLTNEMTDVVSKAIQKAKDLNLTDKQKQQVIIKFTVNSPSGNTIFKSDLEGNSVN